MKLEREDQTKKGENDVDGCDNISNKFYDIFFIPKDIFID